MSTAGWDCDIDVGCITTTAVNNVPVDKSCDSSNGFQKPLINASPQTAVLEPGYKRARLSQDNVNNSANLNGFGSSVDKSTMGWPFRPDLMQIFRSTFDGKFKTSLAENLSVYLTRLNSTEEAVESLKKEFKELSDCMEHIKGSSDDLKKLITERVNLPAPSSGIGQRRMISSQAPRQPSLTSCDPLPSSTSDVSPGAGHMPPTPLPSFTPCRPPETSINAAPVTAPAPLQSQVSTAVPVAVGLLGLLNTSLPTESIATTSVQSQPDCKSNNPLSSSLSVRPMETIDLTADPSPSSSSVEEVAVAAARPKVPISRAPKTHTPSRQAPLHSASTSLSNASYASKIAWFAAHSIPVTVSRNQRAPILQTSQLTFRDLQRLPVAPLPPIPFQSSHPFPVQPMPQLTIAEAAEGVCLQWTIGYQSLLFEAATAYEIYSYASSELTAESIFTCLPWKKVGEVAALPLPMACTLTHVQSNNMYYFIVRSVDRYRRYSSWSNVVNAYVG